MEGKKNTQKIHAMIRGVDRSTNAAIRVIEENSQADATHSSSETTSALPHHDVTLLWSHQLSGDFTALLSFPNINSKARSLDFTLGTVKTQQV